MAIGSQQPTLWLQPSVIVVANKESRIRSTHRTTKTKENFNQRQNQGFLHVDFYDAFTEMQGNATSEQDTVASTAASAMAIHRILAQMEMSWTLIQSTTTDCL